MISKIINKKLLTELRKLDIPCPDITHDVVKLVTFYNSFTIHSYGMTLFVSEIFLAGGSRTEWPGESLSILGPVDVGKKEFNIASPTLFKDSLKFITERWKAIQRFEDFLMLRYIEGHLQSGRALFNRRDLNRLLILSGHKSDTEDIEWASLPHHEAMVYVNKARENLTSQQPNTPSITSVFS